MIIMKKLIISKSWIPGCRVVMTVMSILYLGVISNQVFSQNGSWVAPASTANIKNPYQGIEKATKDGKKLFAIYCAICHGNKGKGDGIAGMALNPRPSDFRKDIIQKQTDGAIFWKLTEGKAPMAAYKETLTEKQRWQLVNFIRTLKK